MQIDIEKRHAALKRLCFHTRYSGGPLLIFGALLLGTLTGVSQAEEYWYSYQGNDFPENEGWSRFYGDENGPYQGGAERSIEDGIFIVDSLRDTMVFDSYRMERSLDPEPGELFVMRWRLCVDEAISSVDPVVSVFSNEYRAAAFEFSETYVANTFEYGTRAEFEPGVFHDFQFMSSDMTSYELYIDGILAMSGMFFDVFECSRVGWGDGIQGGRSLSRWDSFEFGVVPEPACGYLCVALLMIVMKNRVSR